jgi:hypothetical protein
MRISLTNVLCFFCFFVTNSELNCPMMFKHHFFCPLIEGRMFKIIASLVICNTITFNILALKKFTRNTLYEHYCSCPISEILTLLHGYDHDTAPATKLILLTFLIR